VGSPVGIRVKVWPHIIQKILQGRRVSHMSRHNVLYVEGVVELEGLHLVQLLEGCVYTALPLLQCRGDG
jgi:hypothetical protein